MGIKHFNEIDEIYKNSLIYGSHTITCSVCDKVYKRKNDRLAKEHIGKKKCHSYYQVFKKTITEELLYDIYLRICAAHYQKHGKKVMLLNFRKFTNTQSYNQAAKLYMFCFNNKIRNILDYVDYVIDNTHWKYDNQLVSNGIRDSVLIEYRKTKTKTLDKESNEKFYNQNKDRLFSDTGFLLRSLERGDINYKYFFKKCSFDNIIDNMNNTEKSRLTKFLLGVSL
jgi:hypothetical protein